MTTISFSVYVLKNVVFVPQDEEKTGIASRVKELEEERNRLARTSSQQQGQIDKYKKLADDSRSKAESLETQLSTTRKVLKRRKKELCCDLLINTASMTDSRNSVSRLAAISLCEERFHTFIIAATL